MTPSNDTPTVRTSSAPKRSDNSTAAAIICDADHNSEVLLLKGEDAESRGQPRGLVDQAPGEEANRVRDLAVMASYLTAAT
jgi:hypothetical protein